MTTFSSTITIAAATVHSHASDASWTLMMPPNYNLIISQDF